MRHFAFVFLLVSLVATQATAQQKKQYKVGLMGFYNLENLFDTEDDPEINDEEFLPDGGRQWTPERYNEKIGNMARVISEIGTDISPDGLALLGVAELENRKVLEDLVKQPAIKGRNYAIVHHDSKDWRGIDCALLYNPKYFSVTSSEALEVEIFNDKGERRYTRDVLYVKGQFDGETMHVFVNHWPSRRGGAKASAPKRIAAAQVCKDKMDKIKAADPNAKILVMGDLNDDPVSPSVKKILKGKKKPEQVKGDAMYNPWYNLFKKGIGTLAYRDAWSLFDQILMTQGLLNSSGTEGYHFLKVGIYNKKYLVQKTGKYKGYPFRTFSFSVYQSGYSDHFPVYVALVKEVKTP